jgi:hypothetical protein
MRIIKTFRSGSWGSHVVERDGSTLSSYTWQVRLDGPGGFRAAFPTNYGNGRIELDRVQAEYGGMGRDEIKQVRRLVESALRERDRIAWLFTGKDGRPIGPYSEERELELRLDQILSRPLTGCGSQASI